MRDDLGELSIEAAVARLEAWGRWAAQHGIGRYGTVEAQLVASGGTLIRGQGQHVEPEHPLEMEIDGILAAMPGDLKRERDALIVRYRYAWLPLEILARDYTRCSVATLKTRVRVGHAWVLAQLRTLTAA